LGGCGQDGEGEEGGDGGSANHLASPGRFEF
jgi:hypothetical protein